MEFFIVAHIQCVLRLNSMAYYIQVAWFVCYVLGSCVVRLVRAVNVFFARYSVNFPRLTVRNAKTISQGERECEID